MKNLWLKKWFKVVSVLMLVLAVGASWVYFTFFSFNPEVEKELQEQFGEEFFTFDLDSLIPPLEDEDDNSLDEEALAKNDDESEADSAEPAEDTENRTADNTSPPPSSAPDDGDKKQEEVAATMTVERILARHEPRFLALEAVALERLETLFATGRQEYIDKHEEGELDQFALANKYIQAGRTLERNIDATFYVLLDDLKEDLKKHGLSASAAREVEKDYKGQKDARRRSYLSYLPW